MIISRTPFRISFFGGGTDFPAHYQTHGGAVLCTTIDKYSYLSVHRLSPFFKHRFRASYAHTETVQTPAAFKHPLIRESMLLLDIQDRMEITHVADLPGRTGLGTSSAFTVGLLHALHAFRGERPAPDQLAREAITVERERVGDAGGHQDQYAAAYGGFVRIDFEDTRVRVRPVQVEAARRQVLERNLLCFYLGTEASAERILRAQTSRVKQNHGALKSLRSLVDEAQRVIQEQRSGLDEWGHLMHAAWQIKRDLAPGITNDQVDVAYDAARQAGALGGKLLGAGGRGFLCFYVLQEQQSAVRDALQHIQEVPFAFSPAGSEIIYESGEPAS